MKEINIKRYSKYSSLILIFIILLLIIDSYNMLECNKTFPFEKSGESECIKTCTQNEISSNICIVKNKIIKNQWINNILYIGPAGFRYINIAVSESNNLYSITSSETISNERYIYILNREGNGFFSINGIKTPYLISNIRDSEKGRFESTVFIIKLYSITNYKDYLLSISKGDQNVELYDYYDGRICGMPTESIFGLNNIFSYSMAYFKLSSNDKTNTYIIGFLANEYSDEGNKNFFYLNKVKFNSTDIKTYKPDIFNKKVQSSYFNIIKFNIFYHLILIHIKRIKKNIYYDEIYFRKIH